MKFLMLAVFLWSFNSFAKDDEKRQGMAEVREHYMSAVGGNMGTIGAIMKEGVKQPGMIANQAKALHEISSDILTVFEKGSDSKDDDAKAKIWTEWSKFEKKAEAFKKASANLVAVTSKTKDMKKIGAAVGKLGKTCKGCHKSYKEKD